MNAVPRTLKPREIAILKRARDFACGKFANGGKPNRYRKPVTIRDYSKPSSNLGGHA